MTAAFVPATEFIDSGVTIPLEVSPRKLDLVRLNEISGVLASIGKVNPDGKLLSDARIVELTYMESFPPPAVNKPGSRMWYRRDVLKWGQEWDQKSGWPAGKPRPVRSALDKAADEWTPPRATTTADWSPTKKPRRPRKGNVS